MNNKTYETNNYISCGSIFYMCCAIANTLPLPKGYQRLDKFPIDSSSVYSNYADLEYYTLSNASAYAGQILTLANSTQTISYIINADKSITEIAFITEISKGYISPFIVQPDNIITISVYNGAWQSLTLTNDIVIYLDDGNSNYIESIRLDLIAFTNSVSLDTNNVLYESFDIPTNGDAISLLYDSQYGMTNWRAWELSNP